MGISLSKKTTSGCPTSSAQQQGSSPADSIEQQWSVLPSSHPVLGHWPEAAFSVSASTAAGRYHCTNVVGRTSTTGSYKSAARSPEESATAAPAIGANPSDGAASTWLGQQNDIFGATCTDQNSNSSNSFSEHAQHMVQKIVEQTSIFLHQQLQQQLQPHLLRNGQLQEHAVQVAQQQQQQEIDQHAEQLAALQQDLQKARAEKQAADSSLKDMHKRHGVCLADKNTELQRLRKRLEENVVRGQERTAQLQQSEKALAAAKQRVEELQVELTNLQGKGCELLVYSGCHLPGANHSALQAAVKQLSDAVDTVADKLQPVALPMVPGALNNDANLADGKFLDQLNSWGRRHAMLLAIAEPVFGHFRSCHLIMSPHISNRGLPAGLTAASSNADHLLKQQLALEAARVQQWLGALQQDQIPEEVLKTSAICTKAAVRSLYAADSETGGSTHLLQWARALAAEDVQQLAGLLQPAVLAAMRVQVIASAMHSQLVRVCVPGWVPPSFSWQQPNWLQLQPPPGTFSGAVPFHRAAMTVAAQLKRPAPPGAGQEVLLFCQQVAVLQVAEHVHQLPEFGGAAGSQPAAAAKVLAKARVCTVRW